MRSAKTPEVPKMRDTNPPKPPVQQDEHRSVEMTPLEVKAFFDRMDVISDMVSVSVTKEELEDVISKLLTDIYVDIGFLKGSFPKPPANDTEYNATWRDLRRNTDLLNKLMDAHRSFDQL